MISTKNIITSSNDIPSEWIFEYYLNLREKLIGQDVRIHSVFRTERTPSMFVYFNVSTNDYRYKDFSTGKQGSGISMVMELFNLPFSEALNKITADYEKFIKDNQYQSGKIHKIHDKYKVVDYEIRHWNSFDSQYWSSFHIGSKMLDLYNVSPISYFTMQKKELDDSITSLTFRKNYVYGYFREDGQLYKIYMPKNPDKKFIKVQNYIQGTDQLKYNSNYLVITASLKDLMAFRRLGISNIECIAPDSENSMIPEIELKKLKKKYKSIITLFDNDEAGIKSMEKYHERYGFNYIKFNIEKDISDAVRAVGIDKVREELFPLLKEAI